MNTKTMRLPPRRVNNKKNERENPQIPTSIPVNVSKPNQSSSSVPERPNNQLLAGYMAHEFLTKGTIFGQPWNPSTDVGEAKRIKLDHGAVRTVEETQRQYLIVSSILKEEGNHLPGIVNPSQLFQFLQ